MKLRTLQRKHTREKCALQKKLVGLKSDIAVVNHTLSDRGLKLKAVNKHVERKKEIESRLRTKRAKLKSEMNGLTRRLDRVRHKLRKNGQIHK